MCESNINIQWHIELLLRFCTESSLQLEAYGSRCAHFDIVRPPQSIYWIRMVSGGGAGVAQAIHAYVHGTQRNRKL